ncbi:NusG domain II-containing protein [Anaerococcus porci]|uniref:NusG domain II-containing protein n=1 Tax=Anaerococcus porci TaxID=2652269 RepID=UPI002A761559|nr:NusG domain II-containing protein [Anaerococcus porci]MDY3006218.1 NusG domain II-containing protein [Anaerococcus porci]
MKIKRRDLIVIVSLLLLSILMAFFVQRFKSNVNGDYLLVELNGKEYGKYPLDKDKTFKIEIGNGKYNVVEIKDGKVNMKEANCRDLICTHMPAISKGGETIVCLPHRLILEIIEEDDEKSKDDGIDKVVG